ncbi:hypothetical protein ES332_A10G219000v1 [Gossypium tomentosum]|uniref:Uncharacterized protein n=1 Tax=Gossypium tomentosum TaxID=34277 RepID=A0A5D2NTI7_GOSTO|nr:hypothetical protein ES332_A10G219000v1 [Gossypium tomentosum]
MIKRNSLRRPINTVHLRRDGSIEPMVDLAAPLSKKEIQEELEKRQKRKGPGLPRKKPTSPSISQAKESLNQPSHPFSCAGDSSILAVDSIAAYSSIKTLTRRLEGNRKKNEKKKRLKT